MERWVVCPECDGSGMHGTELCLDCSGVGEVRVLLLAGEIEFSDISETDTAARATAPDTGREEPITES